MKKVVLVEIMEDLPRPLQWVARVTLWLSVFPVLVIFEMIKGLGIVLHDSGEWICSAPIYNDWLKMWWKLRSQL